MFFTKEDNNIVPVCEQIFRGEESEKLIDDEVTRELVVREIDKMKKFKSPGPDEVYPRVIKECKEVVSQPLVNIFRKSVDLGEVPSMWRQANVVPIFKKGNRALISNYRPVGLTSIVGKLLESIIANKIREHFEKFSLINDSQHGFSKGMSCLTNLLTFYRNVYEAVDNDMIDY